MVRTQIVMAGGFLAIQNSKDYQEYCGNSAEDTLMSWRYLPYRRVNFQIFHFSDDDAVQRNVY